jgi:hypothetical protein
VLRSTAPHRPADPRVIEGNRLVTDEFWMVAMCPIATNRILDDVVAHLIEGWEPVALPAS